MSETTEPTTTETAAADAPPPAPPPVAETAPAPKPKRTANSTQRAQEQPPRMSDENASKPAPPTVPAEILQQLAQFEAMKAEHAKVLAERESFLKAQEELKTAATKVQEQFAQTEAQAKALAEQNRTLKIQGAVRDAARDHGALDPDDLTELLAKKFTIGEDGNVITADESKAKASDYVKSFLEKKPHYAGRKVAGGSGASPFPAQSAPTSPKFDLYTAEGATAFVDSLIAKANPQPRK